MDNKFQHLYYHKYEKDKDIRKVQKKLAEGCSIQSCYTDLGLEKEKVSEILKYLAYCENHLY